MHGTMQNSKRAKKWKGENVYKRIIIVIATITATVAIVYFCAYNKNIVKTNDISTDKELKNVTFDEEKDILSNDIIGTLIIKKIGLTASIKEGSTSQTLKEYIGHIEQTPFYNGNIGLAAHNRGNEYSYFARLNELEEGDSVIYKTKYGDKNYSVNKKEVILETDWSMLKDTSENKITMITCIKNKPNQRLCVQAIEIK